MVMVDNKTGEIALFWNDLVNGRVVGLSSPAADAWRSHHLVSTAVMA